MVSWDFKRWMASAQAGVQTQGLSFLSSWRSGAVVVEYHCRNCRNYAIMPRKEATLPAEVGSRM